MSRYGSHRARAEQLFCQQPADVQEDRRLTAIKRALGLLKRVDGPGPFTCAKVAQKAAECSGNGITVAALNQYMSNMSDALRKELEALGLAPRQARNIDRTVRSLGSVDPKAIEARYLAAVYGLPEGRRTVQAIAESLDISLLCVESYLFGNSKVAALINDYRGPVSS